ncbi:MAG: rane protein [Rhodospirillales bacterium]|nr:rane protein [Rhodospirillales bacterium]
MTAPVERDALKGAEARRGRTRSAARVRMLRAQLTRVRNQLSLGTRAISGLQHAAMSMVAAILAYLPTQFLGLREGFWAAITAIGVVQTEFGATQTTARDQFTGAALGGLIAVSVVLFIGRGIASYGLAVMLSIMSCWLINVASAARLAGVTATIVLLVPHASASPLQMMISRVVEVGWGVTVAIFVVWLAVRLGFTDAGPSIRTAPALSAAKEENPEKPPPV